MFFCSYLYYIYEFKIIDKDVRIAIPGSFTTSLVNEGSVCFLWPSKLFVNPYTSITYCWIITFIPISIAIIQIHTLFQAILVTDVLQSLNADVGDTDAVVHEVSTDEHLVVPTGSTSISYLWGSFWMQ